MAARKLQFLEEIGKLKSLERTGDVVSVFAIVGVTLGCVVVAGWVLCDIDKPETVAVSISVCTQQHR